MENTALLRHGSFTIGLLCWFRGWLFPQRASAQAVQAYARFADLWDALAILRQIMAGKTYQDFPAVHSTVT